MEAFFEDSGKGAAVRGFLHRGSSGDGLVITHGAGSNANAPLLVSLAETLAGMGLTVLRCDLPFRQSRPTGPPPSSAAPRDREGLRAAVAALRKIAPRRVFLGGQSYGGRQATIAASEDPALADALLLLSYPLHAPQRPAALRAEHFPALRTPALFVHGTRDPFGSIEQIRDALTLIPARTELLAVEGAGHDLAKKAKPAEIAAAFLKFIEATR
ncbi:MAG TPA: dienelactone hydrolase family protein [Bryobacteraceae bacterium]|nr:dienelactone hydrolase family protein [Bryobacteraceae bacterium]HPQ15139.1 dienelactone hydrolase family protein [Bryobacteraceae bacterium]HPU73426.1 dienelactone hydrolase family protein [Bryobacteraceae bacterium]